MARCLVIGGAGFIGSHLVKALLARDHLVRVVDNFSTGLVSNIASVRTQIELFAGDIADEELVAQAMTGIETVFHYAPPCSGLLLRTRARSRLFPFLTLTRNVLTAAQKAGVRRVIYASSARVYGRPTCLPVTEDQPLYPVSQPAIATLANEQDCCNFTALAGLETVRLRYFNVFGPGQSSNSLADRVIGQAIKAMLVGRRPVILGDGRTPQDFIYVDDVIEATLLAAEVRRASGRVYNIGRGRPTAALEIVSLLNGLLGTDLLPIHSSPLATSDLYHLVDVTRSEVELGFCPFTDLEKGLTRCVEFYSGWRDSLRVPTENRGEAEFPSLRKRQEVSEPIDVPC